MLFGIHGQLMLFGMHGPIVFFFLFIPSDYFVLLVYDGKGTLEEGETAEARFIKIQAAYELLIDDQRRKSYDREHHVNPMKVWVSLATY